MENVGAYEAKTHLPALLKRVAEGEQITITRHGQPIAQLSPAKHQAIDPSQAVESLKQFRRGQTLGQPNLRELIEAGRR